MHIRIAILLPLIALGLGARAADPAPDTKASIQRFNQAVDSWKEFQSELDELPPGHLKQAGHLAGYAERMHALLMEMHDATAGLPVSETTKVCLDYALHNGCEMAACAAECCRQAKAENRPPSPEEVDELVVKVAKQSCACTLPIRLAIREDLLRAGVSDRESLDLVLMIPEGSEYQGVANVKWSAANLPETKP